MPTTESEFREIERELDRLIDAARLELETAGVVVVDQSYRSYHYDPLLVWQFSFDLRRQRDSENERVSATLSVVEGSISSCRLRRTAELFQLGKLPRWSDTVDIELPMAKLRDAGLAAEVLRELQRGSQLLSEVV